MSIKERKQEIRKYVWDELESKDIATFPRPVYGRIPNFKGANGAASNLVELDEFKKAKTLKVNPDAPQRSIRYLTLCNLKLLVMPPPRLRSYLILLDPKMIPKNEFYRASSISGAFAYSKPLALDAKFTIDFIVMGSVAVSRDGARIGKGEGYAELEYAVLKNIGAISDKVPVATTVHNIQLVDDIPSEDHDVPIDIIITPNRIIRTKTRLPKPEGVIWKKVTDEMLSKMPILRELKEMYG
ncbi:MAG: 5-formyltetrahydrofolate cyclo-ligase [Nitrososphaerales archaeon]